MERTLKNLNIFVHLILVFIFVYGAPFLLDWRLILIFLILNYIQLWIFGGCILTIHQLKTTEIPFQVWVLSKLGIKVNRARSIRFLRWQFPFIILAAGIIWQEILGFSPLIKL